jgi:hypothetical protein
MKKLMLVAAVAGAAAIFPTAAFAAFNGVVVGKAPGSLAVASKSGAVSTVHTRAHARVGAHVVVSGATVRVTGFAHRAHIHGVIVRRARSTVFLAAGHSLLALHTGRRLSSAADRAPRTGTVVNSTVTIAPNGELDEDQEDAVGEDASVTVQALVTAVAPGSITVSVNGTPLTIKLPAGIQLPASLVGQTVMLTLRLDEDQPVAMDEEDHGEGGDHGGDHGGGGDGGGDG